MLSSLAPQPVLGSVQTDDDSWLRRALDRLEVEGRTDTETPVPVAAFNASI